MTRGPRSRGGEGSPHDVHEASRRVEWGVMALAHDRAGDAPGIALLAVLAHDADEIRLGVGVEDLGRGRGCRGVHAHVQRSVEAVGEAALRFVQLQRGHPEVKERGVDLCQSEGVGDGRELVIHGMHQGDAVGIRAQSSARKIQGPLVAVDTDDVGVGAGLQHGLGMSAHTHRRVDVDRPRMLQGGRQKSEDLVAHHGHVTGRGVDRASLRVGAAVVHPGAFGFGVGLVFR